MWLAAVTSTLLLVLIVLVGLVMYAYYATCDPIITGKIEKVDQVRGRIRYSRVILESA